MKIKAYNLLSLIFLAIFASGCATTSNSSSTFKSYIPEVKTIAVMPLNVRVYELSAGGVAEEIDEWSDGAKNMLVTSLKEELQKQQGYEIKFIDEQWIKDTAPDLWREQSALYEAVALSAVQHGIPMLHESMAPFPTKKKGFDYSMGEDIKALTELAGADALLFLYGYDHEATRGRTTLNVFNLMVGAVTGVTIILYNPSLMTAGLVNGETGALEWIKMTNPGTSYSYRKEKHIQKAVTWLLKDFQDLGK